MVKVAILGFGTVGGGAAEVLTDSKEAILQATGEDIELKYILDLRDFEGSPYAHLVTKDFTLIENDPEVSIVMETIGGVGAAYEFTRRCLAAGKSVVSSNKELVAAHGPELMSIARRNNCAYMFEASVGGGIPVLHPIIQCMTANRIKEVYGIINGTTNYILTQMFKNGQSYADALADAQRLGYAERDPSADVDGHDACRKICILSALCYGKHIDVSTVPTEGIRNISEEDIALAGAAGYEIKLLGHSFCEDENGRTAVYVAPHLVARDNVLAGVSGVINGIVLRGNNVGDVLFSGAGAGKLPTASAVMSDVIEIMRNPGPAGKPFWSAEDPAVTVPEDEIVSRWFVSLDESTPLPQGTEAAARIEGRYAVLTPAMDRKELEKLTAGRGLSMYRLLD